MVALFLWTNLAFANGVLEINQACAENSGCFPGDTAGFPVSIGSPGSYKLTGNLDLSGHPTVPAVSISTSFVTFDLGGFQIVGATSCEPGELGFDLECNPSNSGAHGVEMVGELESVSIRNGTIRKMPDDGIGGASAVLTHVEKVAFSENAGWGALLGDKSLIQGSRAQSNGDGGFSVEDDSNISQSLAFDNDGVGFEAGVRAVVESCNGGGPFLKRVFVLGASSKYKNNTANWQFASQQPRCGGGVCTSQRRYYLTIDPFLSTEVPSACPDGFHTASAPELVRHGEMIYDHILGFTHADSGFGVPNIFAEGWIRHGNGCSPFSNCDCWTSVDSEHIGSNFRFIDISEWNDPANVNSPWDGGSFSCDVVEPVWCIEN